MKKILMMLVALLMTTYVAAESLQPVDRFLEQRLDCFIWCEKNGNSHLGYADFWPLQEQKRCKEFDELGGQPAVTLSIVRKVNDWADKSLPKEPRYYLATVPKRGLAQDVLMKRRQDKIMEQLGKLRMSIIEAYSQCVALGIDNGCDDKLKKNYEVLILSKNWKDIGARDSKSLKAATWLLDQIFNKCAGDVKEVYSKVLTAKASCYQQFSAKHPELVQLALARQRIKKAEQKAAAAEERAQNAERAARDASWVANNAAIEAADAQQAAESANRRAAAQFR